MHIICHPLSLSSLEQIDVVIVTETQQHQCVYLFGFRLYCSAVYMFIEQTRVVFRRREVETREIDANKETRLIIIICSRPNHRDCQLYTLFNYVPVCLD